MAATLDLASGYLLPGLLMVPFGYAMDVLLAYRAEGL